MSKSARPLARAQVVLTTVDAAAAALIALTITVLAVGLKPAGLVGHLIWSSVLVISVAVSTYCSVRLSRDYGVPGQRKILPGAVDRRREVRCFVPFWRRAAWEEFAALRVAAIRRASVVAEVVAVSKQAEEDIREYRAEAREQKTRFRHRLSWLFDERPPDLGTEPPTITDSRSWASLAAEAAADTEIANFLLRHREAHRHRHRPLPFPDDSDRPPDGSDREPADTSDSLPDDALGGTYGDGDGGPADPADSANWWQLRQADDGDSAATTLVNGHSAGADVVPYDGHGGLDHVPIHDLADGLIAGIPWLSAVIQGARRIDVILSGRLDAAAAVEDLLESVFWVGLASGLGFLADAATGFLMSVSEPAIRQTLGGVAAGR
jgi:hypothetical protein